MENEKQEYDKGSLSACHLARFLAVRSGLEGAMLEQFRLLVVRLAEALETGDSCIEAELPPLPESICIGAGAFASGAEAPLVYDGKHLYFHRFYRFESRLAMQLLGLAGWRRKLPAGAGAILEQLFDGAGLEEGETDFQRKAAELALCSHLAIISGGPGTGKTTTVVKLLAALVQSDGELKIALAAPTGKAAMRLAESVNGARAKLAGGVAAKIPAEASTLHRLLGSRPDSIKFRHDHTAPLAFNVVVVDEASMVDLALMSRLVDALQPETRLILLGDRDQLSSVESGAVLADLLVSLPQCSMVLKKAWRYNDNIRDLAAAINGGEAEKAWELLQGGENLQLLGKGWRAELGRRSEPYMKVVGDVRRDGCDDVAATNVFRAFHAFQILCATRRDSRGVKQVNAAVTRHLAAAGFYCPGEEWGARWYAGRPVMVTANDYSLDLFNGDIGICLPGREGEGERVWFESGEGFKVFLLNRLPSHETVFAMTIHKSQGSEYDTVAVVLPDAENRILSRELVYTGITRARKGVIVVAEKESFKRAVITPVRRQSGLRELFSRGL